jgi:glycosyltransferase involved in cell wall biosynthesis
MRVALNGWFLVHNAHTGTGQYLRALCEWLPRVAPQHEYYAVVPSGRIAEYPLPGADLPSAVRLHPVPCGASDLDKVRFEQILFPRACRALRADAAHAPHWAPPLASSAPVVVTVHDLIPLLTRQLPEYRGGLRVRLYTALVAAASAGASLVLADSDASRNDILQLLRIPAERVRTVYLAAGEPYTPDGDWRADESARQKYGLAPEGGYVLYLGGFDARKNVRALLSAWTWADASIGQNYPLVLGGQLPAPDGRLFEDFPALARELDIADTVKFIGPVDEADKPALYRGASVFVYPSRYEGFGLPPLEAMACGVPVVASNAASVVEVVGRAGYLLPPGDTRAFGAAIITCVVEPSVAEDLSARGLEQAKKFSWEKTARETAAAYETVVR